MSCLGLVPETARLGGIIRVAGQQVNGASASQLAALRGGGAAMIFQNPMKALNPFFTVGRQMFDVISCHRQLSKAQTRAEALSSLEAVSMPDPPLVLAKYPHQLSGGQLQRVVIAMALACRPKLLIADEPTTALDVTVQAQIIALLRKLAREQDLAILFITHNLGVVASLCDRVAVMYAGEVVESGPVDQVFKRPAHPYTMKLMGTVPTLGQGPQPLGFIPGQVPNMAATPAGCAFNPRCERATGRCVHAAPRVEIGEGHWAACHNTLVKV